MVIRMVLVVSGIVGLLFAALFLFMPEMGIQSFHLGVPDVASRLFARNFALALGVIGIVNILASGDRGSNALRAVLFGNLIIHIGAPLVDLTETFERDAGWWGSMAMHALFIIAFGYCLINWTRLTAGGSAETGQPRVSRGRA